MIGSQPGVDTNVRVAGSTERQHNPYLDGVRGVAIVAVLLTHGTGFFAFTRLTHYVLPIFIFGWWGVDLFFVLSGFLITGILLKTKTATNRVSTFYVRRFLRIFPIYYLCLFVLWGAAVRSEWLSSVLFYRTAFDRAAYLLYLQNWLPLWNSLSLPSTILGHFWSLAVEEQFYLIWPWLVWALRPVVVLRICVVGAVCALVLRITLVSHFGPHLWINQLTVTRGEGLLIGSALAILGSEGRKISSRLLVGMAAVGLAIVAFVIAADPTELFNTDAGPYMYTICVSGLALLFGAVVGASQYNVPFLTTALKAPWLRNLGKYSYGLYIYHIPVYWLANRFVTTRLHRQPPLETRYALVELALLLATIYAVAWISFNCFEGPLLRLKSRFVPHR